MRIKQNGVFYNALQFGTTDVLFQVKLCEVPVLLAKSLGILFAYVVVITLFLGMGALVVYSFGNSLAWVAAMIYSWQFIEPDPCVAMPVCIVIAGILQGICWLLYSGYSFLIKKCTATLEIDYE